MKRKKKKYYQSSKIITFENVEKVKGILMETLPSVVAYCCDYGGVFDKVAIKILEEFNIPLGKKEVFKPFQENVRLEKL
jgi:endonuclease III-like uncharacterized protein